MGRPPKRQMRAQDQRHRDTNLSSCSGAFRRGVRGQLSDGDGDESPAVGVVDNSDMTFNFVCCDSPTGPPGSWMSIEPSDTSASLSEEFVRSGFDDNPVETDRGAQQLRSVYDGPSRSTEFLSLADDILAAQMPQRRSDRNSSHPPVPPDPQQLISSMLGDADAVADDLDFQMEALPIAGFLKAANEDAGLDRNTQESRAGQNPPSTGGKSLIDPQILALEIPIQHQRAVDARKSVNTKSLSDQVSHLNMHLCKQLRRFDRQSQPTALQLANTNSNHHESEDGFHVVHQDVLSSLPDTLRSTKRFLDMLTALFPANDSRTSTNLSLGNTTGLDTVTILQSLTCHLRLLRLHKAIILQLQNALNQLSSRARESLLPISGSCYGGLDDYQMPITDYLQIYAFIRISAQMLSRIESILGVPAEWSVCRCNGSEKAHSLAKLNPQWAELVELVLRQDALESKVAGPGIALSLREEMKKVQLLVQGVFDINA